MIVHDASVTEFATDCASRCGATWLCPSGSLAPVRLWVRLPWRAPAPEANADVTQRTSYPNGQKSFAPSKVRSDFGIRPDMYYAARTTRAGTDSQSRVHNLTANGTSRDPTGYNPRLHDRGFEWISVTRNSLPVPSSSGTYPRRSSPASGAGGVWRAHPPHRSEFIYGSANASSTHRWNPSTVSSTRSEHHSRYAWVTSGYAPLSTHHAAGFLFTLNPPPSSAGPPVRTGPSIVTSSPLVVTLTSISG